VIVFARYLPGGRSTTAFAAGIVGYPLVRFRWYTAAGVLLVTGLAAVVPRLVRRGARPTAASRVRQRR
jgi:membrane-associated protein